MSVVAGMPDVGFVLGSSFPPSELAATARAIEDNGFASVWTSEDYFLTGGVAGAAVILGATQQLSVGTGVLAAYARHPALTAMEAATLAAAYPGRFRLGIGTGVLDWLDQQGIAHPRPLATIRGSVDALRRLLAGEELTGEHGGFHFDAVRLAFPPDQPPPIFIGATGPKMTALTGEVADGLLLSVFSSPEFVRVECDIIAASSNGVAKPLSTFAFLSLDDTVEAARERARPVLAAYLVDGGSPPMLDAIGITEELRTLAAKGGAAELAASMPDSWIDQLCVCGDLDTCMARIQALGEAGAEEVALAPITVDSLPRDIARLGAALVAG